MPTFNGTQGNDTLVGTAGDDTINGLDGNDVIEGGTGRDSISGGNGNDYLNGGMTAPPGFNRDFDGDADTLDGGLGDDSYDVAVGDVIAGDAGGKDSVRAWNTDWTLG